MKYLHLLLLCACSVETIRQQEQGWFDYCKMEYTPLLPECANRIHLTCLDGANDIVVAPAEGSNYIGTVCYQELDKQYVYVCGVNEKNQAWVYCDK